MKKTLVFAMIMASLVAIAVAAKLQADSPKSPPPAKGIAVSDVAYVLKSYEGLKSGQKGLADEEKKIRERLNAEQESIKKQVEGLGSLKPGSPDFKKLEEDITKRRADLNVDAALEKKKLQEREARMMYDAMSRMNATIEEFCSQEGIGVVLNYNSEPMDVNNPVTIQNKMNSMVLYQSGKDISDIVLKDMNRRSGAAAETVKRPVRPSNEATNRTK